MKQKKFVKMYSLTTLAFTALTAVSGVIVIVLNVLRGAREAQIVHTSIPVTGSSMESGARFILDLWMTPVSAVILGISLIFSMIWLYYNIKHVKNASARVKDILSERATNFFS